MKVILWIGNEPNQKALAHKIHARFPLSGIVTESRVHTRRWTIVKIIEKVIEKLFFPVIGRAWWGLQQQYQKKYTDYPAVKRIDVPNINNEAAYAFSQDIHPDLIIVSGTGMIKEKMLSLTPSIGILNLHTGLSPYIKGGPNCTNWCIATKQFHLIGNTIMWIDRGIDTGNLLTTELTSFHGTEHLPDIHLTVMEHAHDLYLKAIQSLSMGARQSIPQSSIAPGVTYYTKDWTLKQKVKLVLNLPKWRRHLSTGTYQKERRDVTVVALPGANICC